MNKDFTLELATIIKDRRIEKRMTQEEISNRLNINRSTYANWEQGVRKFDFETVVQICEVLDIDIIELTKEMRKHL